MLELFYWLGGLTSCVVDGCVHWICLCLLYRCANCCPRHCFSGIQIGSLCYWHLRSGCSISRSHRWLRLRPCFPAGSFVSLGDEPLPADFSAPNREELRLVQMQESAPSLTSEERAMINRVLDLQNVRVRNITVPFSEVVSVTDETPMSQVVNICRERNLTRMPILRSDNKRVIGTLDIDAVLYREDLDLQKPASDYVRGALFVPEDLLLEEAMRRMQRTGDRLSIVLDREQRERGIVSLAGYFMKVIFGEVTL